MWRLANPLADMDSSDPFVDHNALGELRRSLPLEPGVLDAVLRSPVGSIRYSCQHSFVRPVWVFPQSGLAWLVPEKSLGSYALNGRCPFYLGRILSSLLSQSESFDDRHLQQSARCGVGRVAVDAILVGQVLYFMQSQTTLFQNLGLTVFDSCQGFDLTL